MISPADHFKLALQIANDEARRPEGYEDTSARESTNNDDGLAAFLVGFIFGWFL